MENQNIETVQEENTEVQNNEGDVSENIAQEDIATKKSLNLKIILPIVILVIILIVFAFIVVNKSDGIVDSVIDTESQSDSSVGEASTEPQNNTEGDNNLVTTVTAYIASITENEVVLDYVDVYGGDEALEKLIADGFCSSEEDCPSWGPAIYDRNVNPKLRTFTLSPNMEIFIRGELTSMEALKESNVYIVYDDGGTVGILQEITIDDKNEVIKIRNIFRP